MWGNRNTINKTSDGGPARVRRPRAEKAEAEPSRAAKARKKKLRKPDESLKAAGVAKASRKEKAPRARQEAPAPKAVERGNAPRTRQPVVAAKKAPDGRTAKARRGAQSGAVAAQGEQPARTASSKARMKKPEPARKKRAAEAGSRARFLLRLSPRTVIILLLFVIFIALSASPVARNLEATGKLKAMERELATQHKTTVALEKEIEQARSPSYIEEEARRQRMVAPGEVLYLVTTDAAEPRVEYRLKALQSMDEAWEMIRKVLHCNAPRQ